MNNAVTICAAGLAGFFLGVFFFGGLWWTVRKGLTSHHVALWFLGSTLLRTGTAMAGFYFISGGDWRRLLICLLGFLIARVVIIRLTQSFPEGIHAS